MKNTANILLKLLGIIFLFWTLEHILSLILYFGLSNIKLSSEIEGSEIFKIFNLISILIQVCLTTVFSYFLLLKTDKIVKILKIENGKTNLLKVEYNTLMKSGLKLIGVFIFVTNIDNLFRTLGFKIFALNSDKTVKLPGAVMKMVDRSTSIIEIIAVLIPIIISIILIFTTDKVIKIVDERK